MTDENLIKYSNILKKIGDKLINAILIAILIGLLFTLFIGKPSEIKQTFKTNAKVEKVIDSLKDNTDFIISRIYEIEKNQSIFYDQIGNLQNGIDKNNHGITELKKIYNAKINNANTFNVAQLDSFFTNRYKDFYNK